jgi:hypothetical protein
MNHFIFRALQVVIILYTQESCSWLNNRVENERGGKASWFIEEHQIRIPEKRTI